MADDTEHRPEAYRLLFGLVGAAMLGLVLVFDLASLLVAPGWVVALLLVLWILGAGVSLRAGRERAWVPLLVGTGLAVVWIVALTLLGGGR